MKIELNFEDSKIDNYKKLMSHLIKTEIAEPLPNGYDNNNLKDIIAFYLQKKMKLANIDLIFKLGDKT
jgi:hypothetical protein